ncbi:Isoleucine--tRNA ligase [Sesbania bispinosa]|nr:Isoleucine--tRNA ligase [Sesbania bispinosa]
MKMLECTFLLLKNITVAVNPKLEYAVVEVKSLHEHGPSTGGAKKKGHGRVMKDEKKPFLIVASELVSKLEEKWGVKLVIKTRQQNMKRELIQWTYGLIQVPPGLLCWEKEIASVFLQTCILKELISIEGGFRVHC